DITSHINGYNHFSDTEISEFKLIQVPQNSTSRIIFLAEFSAIRTLRRIVTMKIKNNDDSFLFINGIRVLSLCWSGPTFYKNIYITPWCRISAYAVGLITGFIVINVGREYRLNKMAKIFGTILIIILTIICLFATYPDYILASGLDRSIVVAYQSLSRTFWAIVIGWILFLCSTHQGGIVNKFLSWPIWAPLARLNYSCYLVHSTVLHTMIYSQRMPFFYQAHLVVNNFISQIFFSYVAAIFVTIFFETPFFQLEKKLFKR
ncbi:unnamed protein product, partial [Adineta steineri]